MPRKVASNLSRIFTTLFHSILRIVLDTNVYISSLVFKGQARKVYDYCIDTTDVFISDFIVEELSEKLSTKFKYPKAAISNLMKSMLTVIEKVRPQTKLPAVCRDRDDNNVLQLCESVKANYLVTGDKDLLILKKYKQTIILSPSEFLLRLGI